MTNEKVFTDFGFTTYSEDGLPLPEPPLPEPDNRAERLIVAIEPLLKNLMKNPDDAYIHWPDRKDKIESFVAHLQSIVDGDTYK